MLTRGLGAAGQRIAVPFWSNCTDSMPNVEWGSKFSIDTLTERSVFCNASLACAAHRLALSKMRGLPPLGTLVIAGGVEGGQNYLVTIAAGLLRTALGGGLRVMSLALLVLGIAVAASGVATIGFGIPINEFTLGTTLIVAGTTALTGGLLLVGISAVLAELGRFREGSGASNPLSSGAEGASDLRAAPSLPGPLTVSVPTGMRGASPAPAAPRPRTEPQVREVRPAAAKTSSSSVEVSAAAIERLRSTIPRNETTTTEVSRQLEEVPLSPTEASQQQAVAPGAPETEPAEPLRAEDRTPESATEALKASRLDFLFRSKPARPVREPEKFDAIWPAETRGSRSRPSDAQTKHEQVERQPSRSAAVTEPAPEQPQPQVVKSGVVDGMAYTLYADGSIEAKLPEGTVRFRSIAELRAHIERSS